MRARSQYGDYKKPSWAPPARLFAPVWAVLYALMALSFGYVGYSLAAGTLPAAAAVPFALNLLFNFLFTAVQFRLRSFALAAADIFLVWTTLIWALMAIVPFAPWVAYINLPYLAWVSFAMVLQFAIMTMNRP
jgi:tryptophan-rich sensory protein